MNKVFRDLCARLPWGVKVQYEDASSGELCVGDVISICNDGMVGVYDFTGITNFTAEEVKPFLRDFNKATDKEKMELRLVFGDSPLENAIKAADWLLKRHYDFRGLIEQGLAVEAPKDMYRCE